MLDTKKPYILDSFALVAYFLGESAGKKVEKLLKQLKQKQQKALLPEINLGEIYYTLYRRLGQLAAEEVVETIGELPIQTVQISQELILKAAKIKATKPISFADAFVVALAKEKNGLVVTHDPEFETVKDEIEIIWL